MSEIHVKVYEQTLKFMATPLIASGGVNENDIVFEFDSSWDGFGKVAIFYVDEGTIYESAIDATGRAPIPWEVTQSEGRIHLGVYGIKDDIIYTSEILDYWIEKGIYVSGDESHPPETGIYEQIMTIAGQMEGLYEGLSNAITIERQLRIAADNDFDFRVDALEEDVRKKLNVFGALDDFGFEKALDLNANVYIEGITYNSRIDKIIAVARDVTTVGDYKTMLYMINPSSYAVEDTRVMDLPVQGVNAIDYDYPNNAYLLSSSNYRFSVNANSYAVSEINIQNAPTRLELCYDSSSNKYYGIDSVNDRDLFIYEWDRSTNTISQNPIEFHTNELALQDVCVNDDKLYLPRWTAIQIVDITNGELIKNIQVCSSTELEGMCLINGNFLIVGHQNGYNRYEMFFKTNGQKTKFAISYKSFQSDTIELTNVLLTMIRDSGNYHVTLSDYDQAQSFSFPEKSAGTLIVNRTINRRTQRTYSGEQLFISDTTGICYRRRFITSSNNFTVWTGEGIKSLTATNTPDLYSYLVGFLVPIQLSFFHVGTSDILSDLPVSTLISGNRGINLQVSRPSINASTFRLDLTYSAGELFETYIGKINTASQQIIWQRTISEKDNPLIPRKGLSQTLAKDDLNNYVVPGVYSVASAINSPTQATFYGLLIVFKGAYPDYAAQLAIGVGGQSFVRGYNVDTWSAWKEISISN